MKQIINEVRTAINFIWDNASNLLNILFDNDFFLLLFITSLLMLLLTVLYKFLFSVGNVFNDSVRYDSKKRAREHRRQTEIEARELSRREAEEERRFNREIERNRRFKEKYPNFDESYLVKAEEYFKKYPARLTYSYGGRTFYNYNLLDNLNKPVNSNPYQYNHTPSYDLNKAIDEAENGKIEYKRRKKNNDDN